MRRFSPAALLLLVGGVLLLIALALPWANFASTDGSTTVSVSGYQASGDAVVTAVLGLLLVGIAFAVRGGARWARVLSVILAVVACLWAALLFAVVKNLSSDSTLVAIGATATVSIGVVVIVIGAVVSLVGAVMTFVGRKQAAVATAAAPPAV